MQTTDTRTLAPTVGENLHPVIGERLSSAISAINRAQKLSAELDARIESESEARWKFVEGAQ